MTTDKKILAALILLYLFSIWAIFIAAIASAESYEQKAKEVERKLDTVIVEGQKQIDYFDAVVLPWLDEQDRKRKEKLEKQRRERDGR
jgi:hypothetical protein